MLATQKPTNNHEIGVGVFKQFRPQVSINISKSDSQTNQLNPFMNLPMSKSGVELKTTVAITRFSDASTADYSPHLSCLLEDCLRDIEQSFKNDIGLF